VEDAMIGQARFTYTDNDMIAAQRAGWRRCASGRNLLVAFVGFAIFEGAVLAGLNAVYGTRARATDLLFVIIGSAALTLFLFGLFFVIAGNHGRRVLRAHHAFAWNGDELGGEHLWSWNADQVHIRGDRARADLAWTAVGAWRNAPDILLLFPSGAGPFQISTPALAAGWKDAPKVFLYPFGGHALALPKRALAAEDAHRLVALLQTSGARNR
jgi:hypothetical protein